MCWRLGLFGGIGKIYALINYFLFEKDFANYKMK